MRTRRRSLASSPFWPSSCSDPLEEVESRYWSKVVSGDGRREAEGARDEQTEPAEEGGDE